MTTTPRPDPATVRAMPAGRELDAAVHELVLGLKVITTTAAGKTFRWSDKVGLLGLNPPPSYSSDWSAAGPLLEEPGDTWVIVTELWGEVRYESVEGHKVSVRFNHTPNAICRAIAQARVLAALAKADGE